MESLQRHLDPKITKIAEIITFLGSSPSSIIMIFLGFLQGQVFGTRLALGIGLSFMVIQALKHSVKRKRPEGGKNRMKTYSFPSGHSGMAFSSAMVLQSLNGFSGLFFTLAAMIAFSRIYLQEHYPSDVLIGMLIGLLSGYIAILLV